MGNTKAIGVAYSDQDITGATNLSGTNVIATDKLGYSFSAVDNVVTQQTSKSTAVTINKPVGTIITSNSALAPGAGALFTVNNTYVNPNVNIILTPTTLNHINYSIIISSVNDGGFVIIITNNNAGTLSQAITINFAIIASQL